MIVYAFGKAYDLGAGLLIRELVQEELRKSLMTHNIFARASQENKMLQVVEALQAEGQVAFMTDYGVNGGKLGLYFVGTACRLKFSSHPQHISAPSQYWRRLTWTLPWARKELMWLVRRRKLFGRWHAPIVAAVCEGRTVWDNLRKVLLVTTPIDSPSCLVWCLVWMIPSWLPSTATLSALLLFDSFLLLVSRWSKICDWLDVSSQQRR